MLRLGVDWIYSVVRGIIAGRVLTSESEDPTLHWDWTQILPFVDFGDGGLKGKWDKICRWELEFFWKVSRRRDFVFLPVWNIFFSYFALVSCCVRDGRGRGYRVVGTHAEQGMGEVEMKKNL
jgi:hypothetical protein